MSRWFMSVSYAPDDFDGDMFSLGRLWSRVLSCVGRSGDVGWIDKYLLNPRASVVVNIKNIYQL